MEGIKFVDYKEDHDELNYAYALCECAVSTEGVKIPRPESGPTRLFKFNCPRCGKELGMYVTSKETIRNDPSLFTTYSQISQYKGECDG